MEKYKYCLEEGYKNQKDFDECFNKLKKEFNEQLISFQERRLNFLLDMANTIEGIEDFIESLNYDYGDFDERIIAEFKSKAESKRAGMKNKLESMLDDALEVANKNKKETNTSDYDI